jgi:antitoxin PrlF
MIVSKLTSKARTTIPRPIRDALHLRPGDKLVYEIEKQSVILTKASRGGKTDGPFRTFHEWSSDADAKAYASL